LDFTLKIDLKSLVNNETSAAASYKLHGGCGTSGKIKKPDFTIGLRFLVTWSDFNAQQSNEVIPEGVEPSTLALRVPCSAN
jgi:hypothetical protein